MSPLTLSPRTIFIGRLIKRHQSLLGGGFSYRQRRDFVTLTRTPLCPFSPPFATHEYVYGVGRGWDPGDRSKLAKTISALSLAFSLSLSFFFPFSRLYTIPGVRVSRGLSCRPCLSTLFDDIIPGRVITRKTTRVLLALNRVTGVFKFVMWVFRYRFLEGKVVEMKVRYVVWCLGNFFFFYEERKGLIFLYFFYHGNFCIFEICT